MKENKEMKEREEMKEGKKKEMHGIKKKENDKNWRNIKMNE